MKLRSFLTGGVMLLGCLAGPAMVVAPHEGGEGGALAGRITFKGEVPAAIQLPINKDHETCGSDLREIVPVKVDAEGGLSEVVVFVDTKGELIGEWKHPEEGYVLDQKSCFFTPYLSVLPRDPEVKLKIQNSDEVLHNIHAYELVGRARRTLFNLSQPKGAAVSEQEVKIGKRSHAILLKCDAHDFMNGYVFVADNPFYAIVKPDGTFAIDGVLPGTYTISAWHPTLGLLSKKKVEIAEGGKASVDFEFTPGGRKRR